MVGGTTYAGTATDEGYADATIAARLGHAARGVTARHYIPRLDEALIAAADQTSERIMLTLGGEDRQAEVLPIRAASMGNCCAENMPPQR